MMNHYTSMFIVYVIILLMGHCECQCDIYDEINNKSLNIFQTEESINTYIENITLTTQTLTSISLDNTSITPLFKTGNGGLNWSTYFSKISQASLNTLKSFTTVVIKYRFKSNLPVCCVLLNKNISNVLEYEIRLFDQSEQTVRVSNNASLSSDENLYVNISGSYNSFVFAVRGIELTVKRTVRQEVPSNIETFMFLCKNGTRIIINSTNSSSSTNSNKSLTDINSLDCLQDKDCLKNYGDPQMMCFYQRCICSMGYRLVPDSNRTARCVKALAGSQLRTPAGCELPYCDLQIFWYMFPERTLSMHLISDHHYYLNEYFEVLGKNESLFRFFVDNYDRPRLVVSSDPLIQLIQRFEGTNQTTPSVSVNILSLRARRRRYVINTYEDQAIFNANQNSVLSLLEFNETNNYGKSSIYFSYYSLANMTYYSIHFDSLVSNYLMRSLNFSDSDINTSIKLNQYGDEAIVQLTCGNSFGLVKANYVQLNWENQNKLAVFFDSRPLLRLNQVQFCFIKNFNLTSFPACRNGSVVNDASFYSDVSGSSYKFHCQCSTGYLGSACDQTSPCYTKINTTITISNRTESISVLKSNRVCANDGMCVVKLATATHYIRTGEKYVSACACKPQYSGDSCQTNLDSCVFPFVYEGQFYNKCVINATDGTPWCARVSRNFDQDRMAANCRSVPCKTPYKYEGNVYFDKCLYRRFSNTTAGGSEGVERAFCSLSRNYDLFKSWRFCEPADIEF